MNTLTDAQLLVSTDVATLLDRANRGEFDGGAAVDEEERGALDLLWENGFLVTDRAADRRALNEYMTGFKTNREELNVTVLTTLQCNFACDYCFQGDHGDYNKFAEKMTLETAHRVGDWIERQLDELHPERLVLTFFGGEPLLNLPVLYEIAERAFRTTERRGVRMMHSIITNGLLLTPEMVDRLIPYGLDGIKITLDGDRDTHNRMRPLRGGQGTFDRIIENIRLIADRPIRIAIGGNFDETSVDSYPALLDFLKEQEFGNKLARINFKPVIRTHEAAPQPKGIIPLTVVTGSGKPLNGTCMSNAGSGSGLGCDNCSFVDDKMTMLREETKRHGFPTLDGVHEGPCHLHHDNAHTIGPDGSIYPCPGFTGELAQSTGHIDGRQDPLRGKARERFDRLSPWDECGDCAFIPVCAGGCLVASHTQLGDMNKPTCHKSSFESALIALAYDKANAAGDRVQ
jgi:uncharacterized protein